MVVSKDGKRKRKEADTTAVTVEKPISPYPKRVRASRKFAKGLEQRNSPMVTTPSQITTNTPVKVNCNPPTEFLSPAPNTADFLTFICYRSSSALPAHLQYLDPNYTGDGTAAATTTTTTDPSTSNSTPVVTSAKKPTITTSTSTSTTTTIGKSSTASIVAAASTTDDDILPNESIHTKISTRNKLINASLLKDVKDKSKKAKTKENFVNRKKASNAIELLSQENVIDGELESMDVNNDRVQNDNVEMDKKEDQEEEQSPSKFIPYAVRKHADNSVESINNRGQLQAAVKKKYQEQRTDGNMTNNRSAGKSTRSNPTINDIENDDMIIPDKRMALDKIIKVNLERTDCYGDKNENQNNDIRNKRKSSLRNNANSSSDSINADEQIPANNNNIKLSKIELTEKNIIQEKKTINTSSPDDKEDKNFDNNIVETKRITRLQAIYNPQLIDESGKNKKLSKSSKTLEDEFSSDDDQPLLNAIQQSKSKSNAILQKQMEIPKSNINEDDLGRKSGIQPAEEHSAEQQNSITTRRSAIRNSERTKSISTSPSPNKIASSSSSPIKQMAKGKSSLLSTTATTTPIPFTTTTTTNTVINKSTEAETSLPKKNDKRKLIGGNKSVKSNQLQHRNRADDSSLCSTPSLQIEDEEKNEKQDVDGDDNDQEVKGLNSNKKTIVSNKQHLMESSVVEMSIESAKKSKYKKISKENVTDNFPVNQSKSSLPTTPIQELNDAIIKNKTTSSNLNDLIEENSITNNKNNSKKKSKINNKKQSKSTAVEENPHNILDIEKELKTNKKKSKNKKVDGNTVENALTKKLPPGIALPATSTTTNTTTAAAVVAPAAPAPASHPQPPKPRKIYMTKKRRDECAALAQTIANSTAVANKANGNYQNENDSNRPKSGRPMRKTKEAATIYMELIGHKLNFENFDDDDNYSMDSFPELPNVRKTEQMENELKANIGKEKKKMVTNKKVIASQIAAASSSEVAATASQVVAPSPPPPTPPPPTPPPPQPQQEKIQEQIPLTTTTIQTDKLPITITETKTNTNVKESTLMLNDKPSDPSKSPSNNNKRSKKGTTRSFERNSTESKDENEMANILTSVNKQLEKSFTDSDDEPLADKIVKKPLLSLLTSVIVETPIVIKPSIVVEKSDDLICIKTIPELNKSQPTDKSLQNQTPVQLPPPPPPPPPPTTNVINENTHIQLKALSQLKSSTLTSSVKPPQFTHQSQPQLDNQLMNRPVTAFDQRPDMQNITSKIDYLKANILNHAATKSNRNHTDKQQQQLMSPSLSNNTMMMRPTTSQHLPAPQQSLRNINNLPPINQNSFSSSSRNVSAAATISMTTPRTTMSNTSIITPIATPSPSKAIVAVTSPAVPISSATVLQRTILAPPQPPAQQPQPQPIAAPPPPQIAVPATASESAAAAATTANINSILGANLMPSKEESGKIFGIASVSLAQSSGPNDTKCTLGKCGSVHKPLGPVVSTESVLLELTNKDRRKVKVNMSTEQIQKWLTECSMNEFDFEVDLIDDDLDLSTSPKPINYETTPSPIRELLPPTSTLFNTMNTIPSPPNESSSSPGGSSYNRQQQYSPLLKSAAAATTTLLPPPSLLPPPPPPPPTSSASPQATTMIPSTLQSPPTPSSQLHSSSVPQYLPVIQLQAPTTTSHPMKDRNGSSIPKGPSLKAKTVERNKDDYDKYVMERNKLHNLNLAKSINMANSPAIIPVSVTTATQTPSSASIPSSSSLIYTTPQKSAQSSENHPEPLQNLNNKVPVIKAREFETINTEFTTTPSSTTKIPTTKSSITNNNMTLPAKIENKSTTPTEKSIQIPQQQQISAINQRRVPVYKMNQDQQQQPQQQQSSLSSSSPPKKQKQTQQQYKKQQQHLLQSRQKAFNTFGAFSPIDEPSVYSFDKEEDVMATTSIPFRRHGSSNDIVSKTTTIKKDTKKMQQHKQKQKQQQVSLTFDPDDIATTSLAVQLSMDTGTQNMNVMTTAASASLLKVTSSATTTSPYYSNMTDVTVANPKTTTTTTALLSPPIKSTISNTNATTPTTTTTTTTTINTNTNDLNDGSDSEGQTFYIPLQNNNNNNSGPLTIGGKGSNAFDGGVRNSRDSQNNEQLIQGVAVKLGTEGPEGPNQRVIMHAKLVTKARLGTTVQPITDSNVHELVKSLMVQKDQIAGPSNAAQYNSSKSVPIGTVQPRFKSDVSNHGTGNRSTTIQQQQQTLQQSQQTQQLQQQQQITGTGASSVIGGGGGCGTSTSGGGTSLVRQNSNQSLFSQKSKVSSTANNKHKHLSIIHPNNNTVFPRHDDPAQMVDAPTFRPTEKEFQDPIEFFERILPTAARFGLCRIIPPANFKPECKISDDMRFTAYNQYVHKMLHRWGPSAKEFSAIKKYLATQSITLTHPPWIGGMEVDLPRLYHTVQELGGLKDVIEKKKWARVAEDMCIPKSAQDRVTKLDDIYCKYLLPYDTLSEMERQKLFDEVEADWAKIEAKARRNADRSAIAIDNSNNAGKNMFNKNGNNDDEDDEDDEDDDDDDDEDDDIDNGSLECIVKGRSMPLNAFFRIARNTMALWFKNGEPTTSDIETEFWRHVAVRDSHVCVHSGSIDSSGWGYGFPTPGPKTKASPCSRHPWNLKVLTNNHGSILRSIGPVTGVTVPTLHVGMLFSACCWYRDPHGLPWIEYLHTGGKKIWYGVPDEQSDNFRAAFTSLVPTHCQNKTVWLPCDTAMVPPHLLTDRGVSLCRTEQEPGQFVIVFPRAYTSSLCTGYAISESVYFATTSWLDTAKDDFQDIHNSCEPAMFSLEQLLFSIAVDTRTNVETFAQVLPMIKEVYEREMLERQEIKTAGVTKIEKFSLTKSNKKNVQQQKIPEENECYICRANLYISWIESDDDDNIYCLQHCLKYIRNGRLDGKKCKLFETYSISDIDKLIHKISDRISQHHHQQQQQQQQKKRNSPKK